MRFLDILDLGLTAANTASNMSTAATLDEMQKQSELAELQRSHMKQLRERIFGIKQLLEDTLRLEQSAPLIAAAGVRLIEVQLEVAKIDPSQFTEFVDKEYVAQVIRQTKDQSYRLRTALSNEERNQVEAVISAWRELPDLDYYLENRDALVSYNEVKDVVNGYKNMTSSSCVLQVIIAFCVLFGFSFIMTGDGGAILTGIILLAISGFMLVNILKYQSAKGQYELAKKQFDEALQKMNVQRMESIEQRYKGGVEQMKLKRSEAKALMTKFFGESSLPMLG